MKPGNRSDRSPDLPTAVPTPASMSAREMRVKDQENFSHLEKFSFVWRIFETATGPAEPAGTEVRLMPRQEPGVGTAVRP